MKNKLYKITEQDLHKIIKESINIILEKEYSQQEWDDAWDEYNKMDGDYPEDMSSYDEVIRTPKREMNNLYSPFGSAYCHSEYKGDYDPMVRQVKSNTLRGMMC